MLEERGFRIPQDNNGAGWQTMNSIYDDVAEPFNLATVRGVVDEEFAYSHETAWKKFYKTRLRVKRQSGVNDFVPILVAEHLQGDLLATPMKGKWVEIKGEFRSYNTYDPKEGRFHLELFVFVTSLYVYENGNEFENAADVNTIYLDGVICKPPVFRTTPFGRQITDLMVVVDRRYNKASYIPCITWGRTAMYANTLSVGQRVKVYGRIQSREYLKRLSLEFDAVETRTAYEVSVGRLQTVK